MIGIMDWGIGGLSVYKTLRVQNPHQEFAYFSDSGFTPYGKTQRKELRARLKEICDFFSRQKIKKVYVACNAASSALNGDEEIFGEVKLKSIIPAGVRACFSLCHSRIGVIGGQLTIASGIYQKRLAKINDNSFSFTAAQALSAFVEAGELTSPKLDDEIKKVLERLGATDAILLACTHYPALASTFQAIAPEIKLLDPALFLTELPKARQITQFSSNAEPNLKVFTTGPTDSMVRSARVAFNVDIRRLESLKLNLDFLS